MIKDRQCLKKMRQVHDSKPSGADLDLTVAIDTQAGRSIRGSSEAPDRYRTYEVSHTIVALVANSRTRVAGGV